MTMTISIFPQELQLIRLHRGEYGPPLPSSLLRQNISDTWLFGVGDPTRTRCPFCVLSANPSRANATVSRPWSRNRLYAPASPWRCGNGVLGSFARAGSLAALPAPLPGVSPAWPVLLSLACPVFLHMRVTARSRFRVLRPSPSRMSRSKQVRQLAVQLASLASFEDVVTHGIQSLLDPSLLRGSQSVPVSHPRPPSRSRSPLPKCAPRRRGSILVSERGSPTSPAVKHCSSAPLERSCLSCFRSGFPTLALVTQEPADTASSARASPKPTPRSRPASSSEVLRCRSG